MGLIRKTLFVTTFMVHPNSKKQRSAAKSIQAQRDTNAYLSKIARQGQVKNNNQAASEMRSTFKCTDCAESIMIEAKKCRFCGLQFSETEVEERIKSHDELESSAKEDESQGVVIAFMEGVLGDDKVKEIRSRVSKFISDIKEEKIANPKAVVESAVVAAETHSECSNCKQMILNTARICRHCQKSVK
jgi:predicted RNA-binding Zn-ribbon protein involved in translation (DUF1610 family)